MGKTTFKEALRVVALGFIGALCISMLGLSMVFYRDTLMPWWVPVGTGLAVGLLSGIPLHDKWSRLTATSSRWLNYLCHVAVATSVWIFAVIGGNYLFADATTAHQERVVVEDKTRETHHKTRRVSRRVYTQGAPYYVYVLTVRFDDGRTKDMTVKQKKYSRTHIGDTLTVHMQQGLFGYPVMK